MQTQDTQAIAVVCEEGLISKDVEVVVDGLILGVERVLEDRV